MQTYYERENLKILQGDSFEYLQSLPDNSIPYVITDPPYGLSDHQKNMEKVLRHWLDGEKLDIKKGYENSEWDSIVPPPDYGREVHRVLKPGGTAAIFCSATTMDMLGTSLRLAGFKISHVYAWVRASRKMTSLHTLIDKAYTGDVLISDILREDRLRFVEWFSQVPISTLEIKNKLTNQMVTHYRSAKDGYSLEQPQIPNGRDWGLIKELLAERSIDIPDYIHSLVENKDKKIPSNFTARKIKTEPFSDLAKKWESWKPNKTSIFEPILIVYKELPNHRAVDYLREYGLPRSINCATSPLNTFMNIAVEDKALDSVSFDGINFGAPPHIVHTEGVSFNRQAYIDETGEIYSHPTVKPVGVMEWIIQAVAAPGELILDPFAGSGSTLEAANNLGHPCVGVELDPKSCELGRLRFEDPTSTLYEIKKQMKARAA